jgi:hypothetical protein
VTTGPGARKRRERKPMPPGREAGRAAKRKPMPPGREARPPRAGRTSRPDVTFADPASGRGIVIASWVGTALLAATAVAGDIAPHTLEVPALVVAVAMFVGGIGAFFWAYVVAIGRSRESEIGLAGVFGLAGSAPSAVQVRLFGSLAVQIAVAIGTAAVRLYSTLSFGILAVMWGLGLAGLWGARYGAFPPRRPDEGRPRRGRA